MRAVFAATIVIIAAIVFSMPAQCQNRTGVIKPEIADAIQVTTDMLAPMRFADQEVYYNITVDDPRHGRYKVGYMKFSFEHDRSGNIVFENYHYMHEKIFSVTARESESTLEVTINPDTGRVLKETIKADGAYQGILYKTCSGGLWVSPESSIHIEKTATYDWSSGQIVVTYGDDPKAPKRVYQIEPNTIFSAASAIFIFKLRGVDMRRPYAFHFFDVFSEKFDDYYLEHEEKLAKGIHRYASVPHAWGDMTTNTFWFGPPSEEAPNGRFEKIIANPQTSRYLTYLPVTKEKALEPVTPIVD